VLSAFSLFNLAEHIGAHSAKGTLEILGKILELRAGLDSVLGIARLLVVNPAASVTNVLLHNR
jgi:hypothetical protein